MPRQNTQLEAAGAEFLVLGNLLIEGIAAYKTYTNMKGYDLTATNPESTLLARIQVKSRWRTNAEGFIIKDPDGCDFVVIALLNRGAKVGSGDKRSPEYFVLPADVVKGLSRTKGWGNVSLSKVPELASYRERWDLIRSFLKVPAPSTEKR